MADVKPRDKARQQMKLQTQLAISFTLLAVLASTLIILAVYLFVRARMREFTRQRLLSVVSVAVLQVNADLHATLTDPSQEDNEAYTQIKHTLQNIRDSAGNLRFVYTMRYLPDPAPDGQIIFVVDAETNPADISHLGDVYYEIDPQLLRKLATIDKPSVDQTFLGDRWGTWLSAYAPLYTSNGKVDGILGIDMSAQTVVNSELQLLGITLGILTAITPLVAVVGWLLGKRLTKPLVTITESVARITSGDLSQRVNIQTGYEFVQLADGFNAMTDRLEKLVMSLEQRVAERTSELEKHAEYLEATAQLSSTLTSILEPEQLISQSVEQIRQRFNLYYVGLFMVDERREWAILKSGTGEAGQAMVKRGHRIEVGSGMIGWSIAHAQPRIAQIASEDAVRLVTPELPETRSEAALPLRSRGQVLGALTVQSDQPEAFDEKTLAVLAVMADQVAVALDNARLFADTQIALEAERRALGEIGREAWQKLESLHPDWGYRYSGLGITPVDAGWRPSMIQAVQKGQPIRDGETGLVLPIRVREQVIGVLRLYKGGGKKDGPGSEQSTGRVWTDDEINLLKSISEQLGIALESARLYEETRRRAERERLTGEITAKMRSTNDPQAILETAVRELRRALQASRAQILVQKPAEQETTLPELETQAPASKPTEK